MKEHDRIVLSADLPTEGLKRGDVGTVVHIYKGGKAAEVEFLALDGQTVAIATVESSEIRPVAKGEITHARLRATA